MDAGLAKDARDLELPPWNKGRYGTAVGRAVHGVLQTVDLATGRGLADAVAAQTLAEGVVEYADLVAALARAAIGSRVAQRAVARPHWRETYVGTVVGDRVVEGIVDLLYRDEDGLVIVDYKTDAVPVAALDRESPSTGRRWPSTPQRSRRRSASASPAACCSSSPPPARSNEPSMTSTRPPPWSATLCGPGER